MRIYSLATSLDPFPGAYPPEDTGSDGPDAAKAAMQLGLISGYLHCLSLADVLDALQQHPAIVGMNWYSSMDSPDSDGYVSISPGADIRGGHEVLCRGLDVDTQRLYFDNSWGPGWGNAGSFSMSYSTLDRLLHEQGDATISLPLGTTPPPPPGGPYRHVADGRTTLGQLTRTRNTTVSHILGVSAGAYTEADETAARKTRLPAGFPFYTTNP